MNNEFEFFGTNQKDACLSMINKISAIYNSMGNGKVKIYNSYTEYAASLRETKKTGIEILQEKLHYTIFYKGDPLGAMAMLKRISKDEQKHWGKPDGDAEADLSDTYVGYGHFRYNGTHVCILNTVEINTVNIYLNNNNSGDFATTEFKYKNLHITAKLIKSGVPFPNQKDSGLHNKFDVSIKNIETNDSTSFDYYGSTHDYNNAITELKGEDLLRSFDCFVSDALAGYDSFEDFCDNFGYDNDSRAAEKLYKECIKSMNKAQLVIDSNLYDFANELQERLN